MSLDVCLTKDEKNIGGFCLNLASLLTNLATELAVIKSYILFSAEQPYNQWEKTYRPNERKQYTMILAIVYYVKHDQFSLFDCRKTIVTYQILVNFVKSFYKYYN